MTIRARDFLGEAMARHQEGRLAEAETLYRRSLEIEPDNAQALRLCGVVAREQEQFASSIALLTQAVVAAPNDPRGYSELAASEMVVGDLDSAESSFRQALECDPESRRALANLGALLQRRGHIHEAIAFHRRYLELEPGDLEVYCNLANAMMDAGLGSEALAELDNALEIAPGHPLVQANKGAVLCGLDKFEAAVDALEAALKNNPGDDLALINLGYARSQLKQFDAAEGALRRAVVISPDNARAWSDLAAVLMNSGQLDEALETCEAFLERHPGERLALATYAFALHEQDRREEALSLLNFDELIRVTDVETPPGYGDLAEFNVEIAELVRSHPSIRANPVSKATMGGDQTGELNLTETESLSALKSIIHGAIDDAASYWRSSGLSDHPAMSYATDAWALRLWGVVLDEGGFQAPHLHPQGWLSGVYYLQLPPEIEDNQRRAGWLEFGASPERLSLSSPPPPHFVEPKAGRLVLFPSYFYHRTLPFVSEKQRISVAFDVVPHVNC
jgi:tetratricopeptide (TPR) repeat protein